MPDNGFLTDLRKIVQLAGNQVVRSLYIYIYIINVWKSIAYREREASCFFMMMKLPQGRQRVSRAPWRAAFRVAIR